jgi:5,10-methylenetetrahydrofolate reductase
MESSLPQRVFSFEFFPPKTTEGVEKLEHTQRQLAQLKPAFFSVTYGAGGTTQDRTLETVIAIQKKVIELRLISRVLVRHVIVCAKF